MRGWFKASCAVLFCLGAAGVRKGMAEKTMQAKLAEDNWPAFLHSGPYSTVMSDATLGVTVGASAEPCTLRLYFTSPARTPNMQPRSIPVVILFNGFQLPASYYNAYKNALSSWGYVALGYDVPGAVLKKVIRDDDEVKLIPALLDWLHQQSMDPSSALYEIVDTRQVAGFGHSRGAKLAALALAGNIGGLQAAVLVDPVDMTATTRAQHYPSAIDALKASPKKALLIGAGITGWCNPADEGWAAFWPHLSPGSWKHKLLPAGHAQFLDVKGVPAWGLDRLCGAGNITHKTAIHLAQGATIAWLQDTFRQQESKAAVAAYLSWVTQKEQADMIEWEVKPESQPQLLEPQLQQQPQMLRPQLATARR